MSSEQALISELIEYIAQKSKKHYESKEAREKFAKLNNDFRDLMKAFIGPDKKGEVPAGEMAHMVCWVAVYTAMDAIDNFPHPATNQALSPDIREAYAQLNIDWRASIVLTTMATIMGYVRNGQHALGTLPLDMQKPEGKA